MAKTEIRIYFVTIPAHAFLHIRNYQSNGYWDFWQKQNQIPNQDQKTICGILDSIKGKLDDQEGAEVNSSAGQIMYFYYDPHQYFKYIRPIRRVIKQSSSKSG